MTPANAAFISVYDYLSSLPDPFPSQTGNGRWTFHSGDQNGALLPLLGAEAYGLAGPPNFAQFGFPRDTGAYGVTGTAGNNEAPGIFTHSALHTLPDKRISAVFHVDALLAANKIVFTHELVGNGNQGDGIDLLLRTVIGGNVVDQGSFSIQNIVSAQTPFDFGPGGLQFNTGDQIVVTFSPRGSHFFDHGFWNIAVDESPSHSVPDGGASSALLMAASFALIVLVGKHYAHPA